MNHIFHGKWITDSEFFGLKPRNVFHRQLDKADLPCDEHRNRHILFRKKFKYCNMGSIAKIYISADDYYKLYINGTFAAQGPAPSYHFQQNYNIIDISKYLRDGENTIAIHTLYQGLINRVWQSGDNRHGLILDLISDNRIIISSDETFKTHRHSAYTEAGIIGYNTQFAENYDSNAAEVDFYKTDFDDSDWEYAKIHKFADYRLKEQKSHMLEFENIKPKEKVKYKPLPKYPGSIFDCTVTVPRETAAAEVLRALKVVKYKELESVRIVDIFYPEDPTVKLMTVRAAFSAPDKTLDGAFLEEAQNKVVSELAKAGFPLKI